MRVVKKPYFDEAKDQQIAGSLERLYCNKFLDWENIDYY